MSTMTPTISKVISNPDHVLLHRGWLPKPKSCITIHPKRRKTAIVIASDHTLSPR